MKGRIEPGAGATVLRLAAGPVELEGEAWLDPPSRDRLGLWAARPGELLTVMAPDGGWLRVRLLDGEGRVRPFAVLPPALEPCHPRRLLQAVPSRERILLIIQKGVELGVSGIELVGTRRSNLGAGEGPRQDKSATWGRVSREAARQCRRGVIPPVAPPRPLEELLARRPAGERWVALDREAPEPLLGLVPTLLGAPLALLVGPEGGWEGGERERLSAAGVRWVRLGPRLLRTETAALAGLALLAAGDGEEGLPGAEVVRQF